MAVEINLQKGDMVEDFWGSAGQHFSSGSLFLYSEGTGFGWLLC